MKKFFAFTIFFTGIVCHVFTQSVKLSAVYDFNSSAVKLNWNMVNSNLRTSYILLKSSDGITWTEVVKDRTLRYYNDNDIYFYNDRYFLQGKSFYRIVINDASKNTIALSPIVSVNTKEKNNPVSTYPQQKNNVSQNQSSSQNNIQQNNDYSHNNSWVIYPNPARDILTLSYKGYGTLKGVVNVQIQDVTGKIVIKFRSGSMYKTIQIPIADLRNGGYFIQVSVLDELMMSQKFIKQ
ncbi:MAG: T9SS type A sorting domain-containing protein [Bacteroidota bacterium]|nr:T9SS type A sorting domain-containing protein [Bacteroidota bacterium]